MSIPDVERVYDLSNGYWDRIIDESRRRAPKISPENAIEAIAEMIRWRTAHKYDAMVLITGDEGFGKSVLGQRIADRVWPDWSFDRLSWTALELLKNLRSIRRGEPILYDEGTRDYSAYDTMDPKSKALTKAFALAREKSAVVFALYPSIWLAPKFLRGRRAFLWLHILERGVAEVRERESRLHFEPFATLDFTISPTYPKLTWDDYLPNDRRFLDYQKVKMKRLDGMLEETIAELEGGHRSHRTRARKATEDEAGD